MQPWIIVSRQHLTLAINLLGFSGMANAMQGIIRLIKLPPKMNVTLHVTINLAIPVEERGAIASGQLENNKCRLPRCVSLLLSERSQTAAPSSERVWCGYFWGPSNTCGDLITTGNCPC